MAVNTIAAASRYSNELDKVFARASATAFLADNAMRQKFVGAKTVILPEIGLTGLADYDRDTGFSRGTVTVSQTSYTLSKDRGRSFLIDREDLDESGVMRLAGRVLGEFVRTEVVPEVDAYVLSKLAKAADDAGNTVDYDAAGALKQFVSTVNTLRSTVGYDGDTVAFVNGEMYAAVCSDPLISRQITVSDFRRGEINLRVKSVDGVAVIPVPDSRMKTAFDFDAGATPEAGGFSASADAKTVYAIIMPANAAALVKKTEALRVFTPEENTAADAYKFDYRLYYDLFVKKSAEYDIYAVTEADV